MSLERLNLKSSNYVYIIMYTGRLSILQQDDLSLTKGAWLWSRDCFEMLPFAVMQLVTRVCQ